MTYYPVVKDFRKILKELHLLLTPNQKVSQRNQLLVLKTLRVFHLERAISPQSDREGRSKPCEGANRLSEVCESVKDTAKFRKAESEETFDIFKGPRHCNLNNVI